MKVILTESFFKSLRKFARHSTMRRKFFFLVFCVKHYFKRMIQRILVNSRHRLDKVHLFPKGDLRADLGDYIIVYQNGLIAVCQESEFKRRFIPLSNE